jgi:hypothetical protein
MPGVTVEHTLANPHAAVSCLRAGGGCGGHTVEFWENNHNPLPVLSFLGGGWVWGFLVAGPLFGLLIPHHLFSGGGLVGGGGVGWFVVWELDSGCEHLL